MRGGPFVLLALGAAIASGTVALFTPLTLAAMGCNQLLRPGSFLAYCENAFGDYEHAAYGLDLEPEAVQRLAEADVIVLGHSHIQFAMSTEATARFFREHGLRFYLFGFGAREGLEFPLGIIARQRVRASIYVVHVAEAFSARVSEPARELDRDPHAWLQNFRRQSGAQFAGKLCQYISCGSAPAFYRSREDGRWIWHGVLRDLVGRNRLPSTLPQRPLPTPAELDEAKRIMARLGNPSCVIFTSTPTLDVESSAFTAAVAQHVGAQAIVPNVDSLTMIDGVHLDENSAERWSASFLRAAAETIERCSGVSKRR